MSGGGASKRAFYIEEAANQLVKDAAKMGLTPETRDLIDKFEECRSELALKARELSIIEALAMESGDENIIDLREQLFMAVKLIHSDSITEIMDELGERQNMDYSEDKSFADNVKIDSSRDDQKISKYDVIERMRKYLNKRAEFKEYTQLTRKPPRVVGSAGPRR